MLAQTEALRIAKVKVAPSVCPFCSAGPKGKVELRDSCKSEGVNEVYVSASAKSVASEDGDKAELIALLRRSNMRVETLFSSADADELWKHRDSLLNSARKS